MIETAERLVASVLKGERASFDELVDPILQDAILEAAADHDVDALVRHVLIERGTWPGTSSRLSAVLDARARDAAVRDMVRGRELRSVLAALRDTGVEALVIKGAALAHTHYPASYLRPRYDTDLLVRKDDLPRAHETLVDLGFQRVNSVSREAVRTQWTFERRLEGSVTEYIDLHWAISNRPLFAAMISFDELRENGIRLRLADFDHGARSSTVGEDDAIAPGAVHALLLACIHQIAHHNGWGKLIWLYDMKLLANRLSDAEQERFVDLAARKKISTLCREVLLRAATVGCSTDAARWFNHVATRAEPSATYVGGVGTRWRSLLLDLGAVTGLDAKVGLVAGHAFPDVTYMRRAYGTSGMLGLSAAYIRRLGLGVLRLTRPVTRQI
jgi:Uncharacterised nucleotidyltransferase